MKEISRTLTFLGVAAVAVIVAAAAHRASQPKAIEGFEQINTEFYPEFADPTAPKGMRVVVVDEDTASVKTFEVAFKEGRWRIPSHHDYPADAKDRLARTSASVIGIKRAALASRLESDFARFNVIDPLGEDRTVLKGHGQRITLTGEGGKVLADYIIGKKVEGEEGLYYVRSPGDKSTYRARVEISLSTRFGDWIESDLLQLDPERLVEIVVEKYSIDRNNMRIVDPERNTLSRKTSSDPWTLDSLNAETEEVNADEVRSLVNGLDDLRIVGVRPKPQGLRADLSIDPKVARNPILRAQLMNSILSTGLLPGEDEQGNPKLISTEGEVLAGTRDGVEYVLQFGDVFTGSEQEVEVGFAKSDASPGKDEKPAESGKDENKDENAGSKDESKADADAPGDEKPKDEKAEKSEGESKDEKEGKKKDELKKSRYLMVYARFDELRLGPTPTKPEKPEPKAAAPKSETPDTEKKPDSEKKPDEKKPDGEKKPDEEKKPEPEKKTDDKAGKPESKADAPSSDESKSSGDEDEEDEGSKPEKPAEEKEKPAEKPENPSKGEEAKPGEAKDAAKDAEYEAKLAQYQRDLEKYENDLKLHNENIEKGRKKVEQLNKRFGPWYYVISAESFDSLRLARKSLVKPKQAAPENPAAGTNPLDALNLPGLKPETPPKPTAPEKPEPPAKPEATEKEASKKPDAPAEAESPEKKSNDN